MIIVLIWSFIINIRNYLLLYSTGTYIVIKAIYGIMRLAEECKNMVCRLLLSCLLRKYLLVYLSHWLHAPLFVFFRIWYFDSSNKVLNKYICWPIPTSAGSDQVVLGDLVHCKEEHSGKVTEEKVNALFNTDFEDDVCDDTYDCSHLDDISNTTVAEVKSTLVKVSILYLSYIPLSTNLQLYLLTHLYLAPGLCH